MPRLRNAALFVCLFATCLLTADNPFVGTWKVNADKSKLAGAEPLQNVTVKYEMDGDSLKATVDGTNAQGQAVNFTYEAWTANLAPRPARPTLTRLLCSASAHQPARDSQERRQGRLHRSQGRVQGWQDADDFTQRRRQRGKGVSQHDRF